MVWQAISTRNETPAIQRGGWLDALRFIAASLMILHHFQAAGPTPLAELINPVFERGGFLITNFFLIDSGYVLMRVYGGAVERGRMGAGDFFLKRFLRIAPAHLILGLSLVGLVLVSGAAGVAPRNPEWFDWSQLPAQLLLVQAWGVPGGMGWNAPSWSLSALIGCYLAFPWILKGLRRLGPWTALAAVVGLYLVVNQLCWTFIGHPVWQMPMGWGGVRALPLFILGMGLAWFAERVWINPVLARAALPAAALGLAALQLFDKHALASLALISTIILASGAIPVVRRSKLIETAAVVSFSIFISNEVVRIAWFGVTNVLIARFGLSEPVQWALWALGVAAALAFAFAFHFAVDAPLQDRIKRRLKSRSGRRAAEPLAPVVSLEG